MAENRRDFLKRAGGTTAALGLPATLAANAAPQSSPEDRAPARRRPRSVLPSSTLLEIQNQAVGAVGSDASGGFAFAAVVDERLGPDRVIRKHLAGVGYSDIVLSTGFGMSPAFYQWIQTMDSAAPRKDGALVTVGADFREGARLRFFRALMAEVVFPAVDAGSQDTVSMSVRLQPELTRRADGSGQRVNLPAGRPRRWLASSFRLSIDGLEDATEHAVQVDALPLRVAFSPDGIGDDRDYEREPSHLEVPNLVFTVPESRGRALLDWEDWFLVRGNCADDQEKNGTLEYLAEDGSTVVFTLRFGHLGLFRLAPVATAGGTRLKAEMYCETLEFQFA